MSYTFDLILTTSTSENPDKCWNQFSARCNVKWTVTKQFIIPNIKKNIFTLTHSIPIHPYHFVRFHFFTCFPIAAISMFPCTLYNASTLQIASQELPLYKVSRQTAFVTNEKKTFSTELPSCMCRINNSEGSLQMMWDRHQQRNKGQPKNEKSIIETLVSHIHTQIMEKN